MFKRDFPQPENTVFYDFKKLLIAMTDYGYDSDIIYEKKFDIFAKTPIDCFHWFDFNHYDGSYSDKDFRYYCDGIIKFLNLEKDAQGILIYFKW
jgi:hypothetical protein